MDLYDAYQRAATTQLALLDLSVAWWETALGQGVAGMELCTQALESLQTGQPSAAVQLRRMADFAAESSVEFGKLSAACCGIVLRSMADPGAGPSSPPGASR